MSTRGRVISASLIAVLALSPLLYVSPAASASKVEIEVWHRWSGRIQEALVSLLRDFEKKQPNVAVKEVGHPGEYIDLIQKMMANRAAGKQPPDLFVGGYNLLPYVATALKPIPIDRVGGREAQEVYKRYEPSILKLGAVDGQQMGLPFALSNIVLYYNMDLFREAGLDPNSPPKTWNDVFTLGKTIKEKTGKHPVAIQKIDNWPDQALIFSNGGKLLSDDRKCVAVNNPQAVEVYEMWARLHKEGLAPKATDEEVTASFTGGSIAMFATTIFRLSSFREQSRFELGVGPFPAFEGKRKALPGGGAAIMIFARYTAKQEAAWSLAKFLTSEEAMRPWTKLGYVPVIKGRFPMARGQEVANAQIRYFVPWLAWPGAAKGLEIDRMFLDRRTKIIYGDLDAREGLKELADAANALLGCK